MFKTKSEMVDYWLRAGIDLKDLNVQHLGVDAKNPDYSKADVYLMSIKQISFDPRNSDTRITLSKAFPVMRISHNGDFESCVDFLSPYGKISVIKIHNNIYCYMESPYSFQIDKANKSVHFSEFLKIAQQNFQMRNLNLINSSGIGC